jgi:hypothetical protein
MQTDCVFPVLYGAARVRSSWGAPDGAHSVRGRRSVPSARSHPARRIRIASPLNLLYFPHTVEPPNREMGPPMRQLAQALSLTFGQANLVSDTTFTANIESPQFAFSADQLWGFLCHHTTIPQTILSGSRYFNRTDLDRAHMALLLLHYKNMSPISFPTLHGYAHSVAEVEDAFEHGGIAALAEKIGSADEEVKAYLSAIYTGGSEV